MEGQSFTSFVTVEELKYDWFVVIASDQVLNQAKFALNQKSFELLEI